MNWTKEWPTERGWYWFCGWTSKLSRKAWMWEHSRVMLVKVRHDASGKPMYITKGRFLFHAEGARGLWAKAEVPEVPLQLMDEFLQEDE